LPTLGRTISPAPENVISQPLVTTLTVTVGDVSLYRSGIPCLPGISLTPKDRVQTLPNRIVGRNPLAPEIWRLRR